MNNLRLDKIYLIVLMGLTVSLFFMTILFGAFFRGYFNIVVFFTPVVWLAWCVYVIIDPLVSFFRSISLWMLVDVAVLVVIKTVTNVDVLRSGPDGMDVLCIILFSPIILVVMLFVWLFPFLSDFVIFFINGFPKSGRVFDAWIQASFPCFFVSLFFVFICKCVRKIGK